MKGRKGHPLPTYPLNPALRRAYDLRGVVGATLTEGDAFATGLRFAAVARSRGLGARGVAVSRDGRLSSPALEAALVDGLVAGSLRVVRLPLGPTPLMSFAVHRLGLDGGIMVTGSHNPPDQNGFKPLLGGAPLHGGALGSLWDVEPIAAEGGAVEEADISEPYFAALRAEAGGAFRVAWDSGNGATGGHVERLAQILPGTHQTLHTDVDGRFPNHHPDPSVPENLLDLQAAVVRGGCDLGFAFDGDGDRVGTVDGTGAIVWADQLLLLLACDVLRDRPGSAIVADVKSSGTLFDGIAAAGGRPVMGPSGYVLVRERMLAEGAPLGGEMSGHIFFADRWHAADDGLYVAMRVLGALARSGQSLAAFRESLPPVAATPELRLPCPDGAKGAVIEALAAHAARTGAALDRTDGVRARYPDGWWLVRASGTEAKITARVEACDREAIERLKGELFEALERAGVPVP